MNNFFVKLLPANYQYPKGSFRKVFRQGSWFNLDISDYMDYIIYYGIDSENREPLERIITNNITILDIGVNIGETLLLFANKNNQASQEIFNIGYPEEEYSIRQLAEFLIEEMKHYPAYKEPAEKTQLISTSSKEYYGSGYQDVSKRVPSIKNIQEKLDWQPKITLREGIKKTLAFYF